MLLQIVRPKPIPEGFTDSLDYYNLPKSLKSLPLSSSLIPSPVSETENLISLKPEFSSHIELFNVLLASICFKLI